MKVERARAEVSSLCQASARLAQDPSPQSQVVVRDLHTRIAQANGILAKADASIKRTQAISTSARLSAHPTSMVAPAQRARLALAVLLAVGAGGVAEATGRTKRGRDDEEGGEERVVRRKLEEGEKEKGWKDNENKDMKGDDGVIDLDADGEGKDSEKEKGKGPESAAKGASAGKHSLPRKEAAKDVAHDAAVITLSKRPEAKNSAPLTLSSLDAVIARAAVETGLMVSRGEGELSVIFRCPNVYCARLWLTHRPPSGDAPHGSDPFALYADHAVAGAAINGVPERWGAVNFAVFQLLTERAGAASRYYWTQHGCVARAFLDFAHWLMAHNDIFERTCEGKRLAFDAARGIYMPPCVRAFCLPSEIRFPRGCIPLTPQSLGATAAAAAAAAAASASAAAAAGSSKSAGQQANRQHLQQLQTAHNQQLTARQQEHQKLRQAHHLLEQQKPP